MNQNALKSDNYMIKLDNVNKWYGQFHVLKNINLHVKHGGAHCAVRAVWLWKIDDDSLHQSPGRASARQDHG